MNQETEITRRLSQLKQEAPAGFAIALHIRFNAPQFLFQTYPKPWIDYYSQNGLVMLDPTVRWGFENVGQIRWSKLAANDSDGVLALSAEHGLKFGLTYSFGPADRRSIASFARSDREFTDEEVTSLYTQTDALTAAIDQAGRLDDQTQGYLRKMSVIFTHP